MPRMSADQMPSTGLLKGHDSDQDVAEPSMYAPPSAARLEVLPVEEEERLLQAQSMTQVSEKSKPVSWASLPRKDQLLILTLARLSEPLTQTSLQSYMFYQLRSFSPSAPDSTISYQAGMLQAAFTGAQFCTALIWGRMADWEQMGRKRVILVGLLGTGIGALGFGFSNSFAVALLWRALGGALNGNIGVMRTMISEIIRDKKYQSRAFLLLPMTFNVGVIVGPILGGLLADPAGSYPSLFGSVAWLKQWPYALPNIVSAGFLFLSAMVLLLGLEESHEALKDKPDLGLRIGRWLTRTIFRSDISQDYQALSSDEMDPSTMEMQSPTDEPPTPKLSKIRRKLPFSRIWTANVLFTFTAHFLLAGHVGTFNSLWFVFLSTPRYVPHEQTNNGTNPNSSLGVPPDYKPHPLFSWTGGLALPPAKIGTALAILGVVGISLQLLLYPKISFRLGTVTSFRLSLCFFPLAYFLVPFLSLVPTTSTSPAAASGPLLWVSIVIVLCIQVTARTFALPATAILINNACPHPSVLGSVHGLGQSASSAARTIGPLVLSYLYGVGLRKGVVGLSWWCMAGFATIGAMAGLFVKDGDGHEIWLEGEKEEEEDQGKVQRH
ncbi:MFS general substrate transporter [Aureobasidium pullulans]|nr:MFS general substrate transporter [Aureobasidium pullulans]